MQNWFNLAKSINKIHYINSIKEKHPVFISIDAEKVFNKIHHPVRIKSLSKTKLEENFLYQIQVIYKKTSQLLPCLMVKYWMFSTLPENKRKLPNITTFIQALY